MTPKNSDYDIKSKVNFPKIVPFNIKEDAIASKVLNEIIASQDKALYEQMSQAVMTGSAISRIADSTTISDSMKDMVTVQANDIFNDIQILEEHLSYCLNNLAADQDPTMLIILQGVLDIQKQLCKFTNEVAIKDYRR